MKKYISILIVSVLCSAMILLAPFFDSCRELTEDVLRVHILANSDSAADQSLKLCVRDRVVEECSSYYDGCSGKAEALEITRAHLPEIESIAADEIHSHGFSYPVHAEVSELHFSTRYYDDFTMPAGLYDSLRLTIGEGRGQNWWCVMYPSLCVGAACDDKMREQLDDGEYRVVKTDKLDLRFKIVEYFDSISSWFV